MSSRMEPENSIYMNYLIDLSTLKHYSYLDQDINDEKLSVTLKRIQDTDLEPALGSLLYRRLLQGVEDNDLTALETKLMVYVMDFIFVACELKASTHNNWKIRNKSVGSASDENIRSYGLDEYNVYRSELEKDYSFYKNRLIGYLIDNKKDYPLYIDSKNKQDINPEGQGNNYKSRMSFL